jgi:hypothetical protein
MGKAPSIIAEIPREEIIDAIKSHSEVSLRIKRTNSRGQWATVTRSILMPTSDLLTIDDWLLEQAGGGGYRIEATVPEDPARQVVKPFMIRLEGPERTFGGGASAAADPYAAPPGYPAPPQRPGQPQLAGPPRGADDPRRYMHNTPDELASRGWSEAKRERDEERRARAADKRQFEEQMALMRKSVDDMREAQLKQTQENHERMLEAKIAALGAQQPEKSSIDWGGVAVAMAPVVTALISANSTRAVEMARLAQDREGQSTELLKTVVAGSQNQNPLGNLEGLITLATPFVTQMMANKDPSKMADLMATMSDAMLTQASMGAQIYEQLNQSQGGEPPWMPIVSAVTESAEKMAETMMDRGPSTPTVVAGAPPGAQPATANGQPPPPTEQDKGERMNQIMGGLPPYLHSQEVATIVFHCLDEDDAKLDDIAEAIADVVIESNAPEMLKIASDVSNVGPIFLDLLPLSPAYREKLLGTFLHKATTDATPAASGAPSPASNGARRPSGMLEGDDIPTTARATTTTH